MSDLKHATLLVADPAFRQRAGLEPAGDITQTRVLHQAQWQQLLIQRHVEPGHVAPTPMKPVPELQLILRTAGVSEMTLTAGGRVRRFQPRPGDLFLTAAHQPAYEMRRESLCGQPVQNTHLYLGSRLLAQTALETLGVDETRVELRDGSCLVDPLLRQLTYSLGLELESPAVGSRLFTDTAAQLVAAQLLRQHCTIRYALPEQVGKLPPARLRLLTDYIRAQLAYPLTISELASVACLSPYYFCRIFKRTTGLSPNQYVMEQRLRKAQELLAAGQPVRQVAEAVGYESPRHFAQLFRRYAGCTPAQYRLAARR